MTVHSAKGLEFFAVFITGLEEGLFPHENSLNELDGLEEERRLMYVAITRARRRLYVSFAQSRLLHGQTRYGIKSRFLEELPDRGGQVADAAAARGWGRPLRPVARRRRAACSAQACRQPGLLRMACASASRCVTRASAKAS